MTGDEQRIDFLDEPLQSSQVLTVDAVDAADREAHRVQRDRMTAPDFLQQLARVRIREEIFRDELRATRPRGAGRHLGQMRQPQADAGAASVGALLRDLGNGGARHGQAFGFRLPLTMRSQ